MTTALALIAIGLSLFALVAASLGWTVAQRGARRPSAQERGQQCPAAIRSGTTTLAGLLVQIRDQQHRTCAFLADQGATLRRIESAVTGRPYEHWRDDLGTISADHSEARSCLRPPR